MFNYYFINFIDVEDCKKTFYSDDKEISMQLIVRGLLGCLAGHHLFLFLIK